MDLSNVYTLKHEQCFRVLSVLKHEAIAEYFIQIEI